MQVDADPVSDITLKNQTGPADDKALVGTDTAVSNQLSICAFFLEDFIDPKLSISTEAVLLVPLFLFVLLFFFLLFLFLLFFLFFLFFSLLFGFFLCGRGWVLSGLLGWLGRCVSLLLLPSITLSACPRWCCRRGVGSRINAWTLGRALSAR